MDFTVKDFFWKLLKRQTDPLYAQKSHVKSVDSASQHTLTPQPHENMVLELFQNALEHDFNNPNLMNDPMAPSYPDIYEKPMEQMVPKPGMDPLTAFDAMNMFLGGY